MTIVAWGIGHEMKTPVARVAAVPGQGEKDQGTPTARGLPASPIAFKAFCGRKSMAKEFLGPVFQVESFPEQSRRIFYQLHFFSGLTRLASCHRVISPRKKVVRIVPQVNLDDEDCDSTLLQLLRESFDRNQEPKIGSGSVSNEMVMEREQKDNVHSQETEKASVSQVSLPSRASALRKGSASSGFLECW